MDEFIGYYFLVEKEDITKEQSLLIAESIMNLQIQIGHIPETDQIEFIQLN